MINPSGPLRIIDEVVGCCPEPAGRHGKAASTTGRA
jgi:hypothetical protein